MQNRWYLFHTNAQWCFINKTYHKTLKLLVLGFQENCIGYQEDFTIYHIYASFIKDHTTETQTVSSLLKPLFHFIVFVSKYTNFQEKGYSWHPIQIYMWNAMESLLCKDKYTSSGSVSTSKAIKIAGWLLNIKTIKLSHTTAFFLKWKLYCTSIFAKKNWSNPKCDEHMNKPGKP